MRPQVFPGEAASCSAWSHSQRAAASSDGRPSFSARYPFPRIA